MVFNRRSTWEQKTIHKTIKVNVQLVEKNMNSLKNMVIEYKDVFAWTLKYLKGIPLKLM